MTYLDDLLVTRRAAVEQEKRMRSLAEVRAAASEAPPRRDFARALVSGPRPAIIAEFKRASPSAGPIAVDADARAVAMAYERAGAAALSVLTEPERFNGSFDDLRAARSATSLPLLCKDFVVDGYQIWQAAAGGADAVLLIAAAMSSATLGAMIALAREARVTPLVEVHDADELLAAVAAGADVVGVNNRDLHTFAVDTSTAVRLKARMTAGIVCVAESGYRTADDISRCAAAGYDAVLVGEALMREPDPGLALSALRGMVR